MSTLVQAVFGRYLLVNLAPVLNQRVVEYAKQQQVDIDNVRENARRVTYE